MKNLLLIITLIFGITAYSQDTIPPACGFTDELEPKLERELKPRAIQRYMNDEDEPQLAELEANIPVIVHVVLKGEDKLLPGYIPYGQAQSAVVSLNDAFRNQGLHYDENNVDMGVNFCLKDVVYHRGDIMFGDNYIKNGVAAGGSVGIPDSHLAQQCKNAAGYGNSSANVYHVFVVHGITPTNVAGFAYFNNTNVNYSRSGFFVRYNYVGHEGYKYGDEPYRLNAYYGTKNKTFIHEAGHSLGGLYHVFQGASCEPEKNPALQGDRVADTPPQTMARNCATGACGFVSNNNMDYLHQDCRLLFTPGQRTRMKMFLNNTRPDYFTQPTACNDNPTEPTDPTDPVDPPKPPIEVPEVEFALDHIDNIKAAYSLRKMSEDYNGYFVRVRRASDNEEKDIGLAACDGSFDVSCYNQFAEGTKTYVTTLYDISGNNMNATSTIPHQQPELIIDKSGLPSIYFDNKDDRLEVGGVVFTAYSLNIVVKHVAPFGDVRALITKRPPGWDLSYLMIFTLAKNKHNLMWDQNQRGNMDDRFDTGFKPELQKTYRYTFVRPFEFNRKFYIDGELESEHQFNSPVTNRSVLTIGNDPSEINRGFGGPVYELIITDDEMTEEERLILDKNQFDYYGN